MAGDSDEINHLTLLQTPVPERLQIPRESNSPHSYSNPVPLDRQIPAVTVTSTPPIFSSREVVGYSRYNTRTSSDASPHSFIHHVPLSSSPTIKNTAHLGSGTNLQTRRKKIMADSQPSHLTVPIRQANEPYPVSSGSMPLLSPPPMSASTTERCYTFTQVGNNRVIAGGKSGACITLDGHTNSSIPLLASKDDNERNEIGHPIGRPADLKIKTRVLNQGAQTPRRHEASLSNIPRNEHGPPPPFDRPFLPGLFSGGPYNTPPTGINYPHTGNHQNPYVPHLRGPAQANSVLHYKHSSSTHIPHLSNSTAFPSTAPFVPTSRTVSGHHTQTPKTVDPQMPRLHPSGYPFPKGHNPEMPARRAPNFDGQVHNPASPAWSSYPPRPHTYAPPPTIHPATYHHDNMPVAQDEMGRLASTTPGDQRT